MSAGPIAEGPGAAPRVRAVFGSLMLVMLLAALDQTIVATALPTIVGELGGLSHLSRVVPQARAAGRPRRVPRRLGAVRAG